ncbi:MAG: cation diffusion facilitator family transporter [Thermodesulfobacteriota bacterium]
MHNRNHSHNHDVELRGHLKIAAYITAAIFFVELIGGYLTNSLALMSDAAHVLMDVAALAISWFAHYMSTKPATETKTFGLHRFEVFASLVNGLSLLFISLFIFYRAAGRLMHPEEVESVGMLIVAAIGLGVNLFVAFFLRGFAAGDLNVRSAYFHVIGDSLASVGVIIGALIIYKTGWQAADPVISFFIGAIIIFGSVRIINESMHILLEGVPREIEFSGVVEDIKSVEGVTGVHSLHIWSICYNIYALSAHVDVTASSKTWKGDTVKEINEILARKHRIFYTTLQADCVTCSSDEMLRKIEHHNKGA